LEDFILWVIVSLLRAVLVVGFKKLLDLGIPPIHLATIDSYREILSNYTSHCCYLISHSSICLLIFYAVKLRCHRCCTKDSALAIRNVGLQVSIALIGWLLETATCRSILSMRPVHEAAIR
jgi:hypothetical protein